MAKELGSQKADFEDWFPMWGAGLFLPSAEAVAEHPALYGQLDEIGTIPVHIHTSKGCHVKMNEKYPPRVCPGCQTDTLKEAQDEMAKRGVDSLWLPSH